MEEKTPQLMQLLTQEYDLWVRETGNTGGVTLQDLRSAVAMMGDLHDNGRLVVSEEQAKKTLRILLDELNEKSLYAQSRSVLPALTKGMPAWVKWLVLAVGVAAFVGIMFFAEGITAKNQAETPTTTVSESA